MSAGPSPAGLMCPGLPPGAAPLDRVDVSLHTSVGETFALQVSNIGPQLGNKKGWRLFGQPAQEAFQTGAIRPLCVGCAAREIGLDSGCQEILRVARGGDKRVVHDLVQVADGPVGIDNGVVVGQGCIAGGDILWPDTFMVCDQRVSPKFEEGAGCQQKRWLLPVEGHLARHLDRHMQRCLSGKTLRVYVCSLRDYPPDLLCVGVDSDVVQYRAAQQGVNPKKPYPCLKMRMCTSCRYRE